MRACLRICGRALFLLCGGSSFVRVIHPFGCYPHEFLEISCANAVSPGFF